MKFGRLEQNDMTSTVMVEMETGSKITIWQMFVFSKTEIVISQPWIEL